MEGGYIMEVLVTPPALAYEAKGNCLLDASCDTIICADFDLRDYPIDIAN